MRLYVFASLDIDDDFSLVFTANSNSKHLGTPERGKKSILKINIFNSCHTMYSFSRRLNIYMKRLN